MINMPGADERVARAHRDHPDLPIGLHLNITAGSPLLPSREVPSLVDSQGRFLKPLQLIERVQEVSMEQLRAELRAQAERLFFTGVRFDHLDYHQGMLALYTPFFPLVMELAAHYHVPVRNPVPISVHGRIKLEGGGSSAAAREILSFGLRHPLLALRLMPSLSPAAFKRQARALGEVGIPTPDWFVDSFYGNATLENFLALLAQLPPGTSEVMVHPAVPDDDLRRTGDEYLEARATELDLLVDSRLREALAEERIRLIDFGTLSRDERESR